LRFNLFSSSYSSLNVRARHKYLCVISGPKFRPLIKRALLLFRSACIITRNPNENISMQTSHLCKMKINTNLTGVCVHVSGWRNRFLHRNEAVNMHPVYICIFRKIKWISNTRLSLCVKLDDKHFLRVLREMRHFIETYVRRLRIIYSPFIS